MEKWGAELYGDPCGGCGFIWSIDSEEAASFVKAVPDRYAVLLHGQDGTLTHPDLAWNAIGYVCHVADNLRLWAQRLVGATLTGSGTLVPGYDQDLLARACDYNRMPLAGALWSLRHAAEQWHEAIELAAVADAVLVHAERGEQCLVDIVRNNAHDAYHHRWDIHRILTFSRT